MTQVHICHLGCSTCCGFGCATLAQDKGQFLISSVDAGFISGGGGVFELHQFASRLFDTPCFIID